jgi:succinate dehydrogenase flavin-adding protein (antitoxin of CptAB toxin-antitoxin module)
MGRSFLAKVSFPGREELHELIDNLAKLFSVRHIDKPTDQEQKVLEEILDFSDERQRRMFLGLSSAHRYHRDMEAIQDHNAIIGLYEKALSLPRWLPDDGAVRQIIITDNESRRSASQGLKTGWSKSTIDEIKPEEG